MDRHLKPMQPSEAIMTKVRQLKILPEEGIVIGPQGHSIGFKDVHGHVVVTVYIKDKGHKIRRCHLIWWKHHGYWPETLVDHVDRVGSNDKISNLRSRTHIENMANRLAPSGLLVGVRESEDEELPYETFVSGIFLKRAFGKFATQEEANEHYLHVQKVLVEAVNNAINLLENAPGSATC